MGDGDDPWAVGETIDTEVESFVSDTPDVVPQLEAVTDGEATTAVASDYTQSGSAPGSTTRRGTP